MHKNIKICKIIGIVSFSENIRYLLWDFLIQLLNNDANLQRK